VKYGKGVRHAEHYLPAFILPVLTSTASLILYGITAQRKLPYQLIFLAYGLNTFSIAAMATANILWITEAFPRWAAAALAVMQGTSSIGSFGLGFVMMPWVRSQGIVLMHVQLAIMILGTGCVGVPVAFWGKRVRQFIDGKVR